MSSSTPNPDRDEKPKLRGFDAEKTVPNVANDQTIDLSQIPADENVPDISSAKRLEVFDIPTPVLSGIDATVVFDQTVQIEMLGRLDQTIDAGAVNETEATRSDVEQTIQFPANNLTIEIGGTTASIDEVTGGATVRVGGTIQQDVGGTVMSSRQIDQTISSVEMTGKDASIWGNITKQSIPGLATAVGSKNLLPKFDTQSIADTRLNLRTRQLLPQDSAPEMTVDADYRLVRLLGKGGMGNVYVARQGSLDRLVALKVIKPLEADKRLQLSKKGTLEKTERQRRSQFISEAVVTGDLEHPNIVPIHDIAVSEDNTLFYSMKRVSGTPWSKVIDEKSRDENLEILLKVCDAIGFAHTRGIVHRDIKPENIMLGDFGIVMVMDWGLALAKPGFEKIDSIYPATGLGGSPAYMAPEMATGPLDAIEPASDIYLLGATLFQIITGNAPHVAPNITECLRSVASNTIRDVQPQHEGELLDIALQAMATRPSDRYPDVVSLQNAIRQYRSHSESIALAAKATESLAVAKQSQTYSNFARAMFGFEEAVALWDGNLRAKAGLEDARLQYADAAYRNGDFDLGLSLLDSSNADHQDLIAKITDAQRERLSRKSRLKALRLGVAALLAFIMVGGAVAIYAINDRANAAFNARQLAETNAQQATINFELARKNEQKALQNLELATRNFDAAELARKEALAEKMRAESSEQEAKDQTLIAVDAKAKAEQAEKDANVQRSLAETSAVEAKLQEKEAKKQQLEAERQREKSEYESYVSRINLVKARIEQNEFDDARRVLDELRTERGDSGLGWEWRWLSYQTKRSSSKLEVSTPPIDLAVSRSGEMFVVVLEDGTVRRAMLSKSGTLQWLPDSSPSLRGRATAVAVAPDDSVIAISNSLGDIEIFDGDLRNRLKVYKGHEDTVRALCFTSSGLLVSASDDRTARLWDLRLRSEDEVVELATCWHLGPVADLAIASVNNGFRLVTAVSESASGYVGIWNLSPDATGSNRSGGRNWTAVSGGLFREHGKPVTSVDISADGGLVVSGDSSGNALVWNPNAVKAIDYQLAIANAVNQYSADEIASITKAKNADASLGDQKISKPLRQTWTNENDALIKEASPIVNFSAATSHKGAVRSVSFSNDGSLILTASDDYTIGIWDAKTHSQMDGLRGHGGWVTNAKFNGHQSDFVISGSSDRSVRLWRVPNTPVKDVLVSEKANITEVEEKFQKKSMHDDSITSVRFDPSGTHVITTSRDQTCKLLRFDAVTQALLPNPIIFQDASKTFQEGSSFAALSLALDPARQRLFVGSADSSIRVWNWEKTTEIGQIESTGQNQTMALTPNGQFLVTGSSDPEVSCILWELTPGTDFGAKKLREFRGHIQAVTSFAISTNGSKIFTGDRGGIGILWDATTGEAIGDRFEQLRGYRINDASFSSDDSHLIISADDFQLTTIAIDSRKIVSRLAHDGPVVSMELSSDQQFALTVSERPTANGVTTKATLWDIASGEKNELLIAALEPSTDANTSKSDSRRRLIEAGRIVSASFSPQGLTIAVGIVDLNGRSTARIFSAESVNEVKSIDGFRLPATIGQISTVTPMPGGQMVTLNGDSAFWWDLSTQQQIRSFRTNGLLAHASFSPNGKQVVTVSQGVKLWDVASGNALLKLELPHSGPVFAAEFSPDPNESVFATAGNDGVVKLWRWSADQVSVEEIYRWNFDGPPTAVRRLSFSPDGKKLVAVGDQGLIRMMFVDHTDVFKLDLTAQNSKAAPTESVTCAAFSRNGKYLATGGSDATGRIWDVEGHMPFTAPRAESSIMIGHADQIADVVFLEDESSQVRVLTVSRDKSIRVWDPRLAEPDRMAREILTLRGHSLGVTGIDVNPNHQTVITSGTDGNILLWPADPVQHN